MTPAQRACINLEVLGSPKAVKAWLAVTDALQAFSHATGAPAGQDVMAWYRDRSEACFKAQEIAARAGR